MKSLPPLHTSLAFDNTVKSVTVEATEEVTLWTDQDVWMRLDGVDPTAAAPALKLTAASSPMKIKTGHAVTAIKAIRGSVDGTLVIYGNRTVGE